MGLSEIPVDIVQLTMLETINVSNNKLTTLRRLEQLPNLREIIAQNNSISILHQELQDMYSLESLNLIGNPVVNMCPEIARIESNQSEVTQALKKYFGGSSSVTIGIPSVANVSQN
jgi:Leucine-rich repeat (LRR) protein